MRKTLFLGLLILALAPAVLAELPDFDFSAYTVPDHRLHQLTLSMCPIYYHSQSVKENGDSFMNSLFRAGTHGFYEHTFRLDKWEGEFYGLFSGYLNREKESSVKFKTNQMYADSQGRLRYYILKPFFFQGDYYLNYSEVSGDGSDYHHYTGAVIAGVGYGRMNPMNDVRRALYIVDELYEAGLLVQYPETKVLHALADLLYDLSYTRVYDSRIKRIEDLKRIDAFFVKHGLLVSENIDYFSLLNDMLFYSSPSGWSRGYELSLGLGKGQGHRYDEWDSSFLMKENYKSDIYSVQLLYREILNRYWVFSTSARWEGRKETRDIDYTSSFSDKISRTENAYLLRSGIAWHPDTRTVLEAEIGGQYRKRKEDSSYYIEEQMSQWDYFLGINFSYYLSSRLTFSAESQLRKTVNTRDAFYSHKREIVSGTVQAQLAYKIF